LRKIPIITHRVRCLMLTVYLRSCSIQMTNKRIGKQSLSGSSPSCIHVQGNKKKKKKKDC
jgi:hypothetical protein